MFCGLPAEKSLAGLEALHVRKRSEYRRRPVTIWEGGPVAQVDRAMRFERRGWEFKSLRVRQVL